MQEEGVYLTENREQFPHVNKTLKLTSIWKIGLGQIANGFWIGTNDNGNDDDNDDDDDDDDNEEHRLLL